MLAGMHDAHHLDEVANAVDQDVVGMDHRFSRAGDATGPVEIGMIGQAFGGVADRRGEPRRRWRVSRIDEVDDGFEFLQRLRVPEDRPHQRALRRSRMACTRAMASSCGMPGVLEANRGSILARNHAS